MPEHQTSSQATFDTRDEASSQEETEWLQESDQLPRRPRRRLLTPLPLSLMAILLLACGFIAGVLVQKGQSSTSDSSGAGLAARFSALRGASGAAAGGTGAASGASTIGQEGSSPQGSAAVGARGAAPA